MLRLPDSVEPPVYGWERLVLLRHLLDQGLKKTDIAARLGVSRGLIYHWLRTGQLDRELDTLPAHVAEPSRSASVEWARLIGCVSERACGSAAGSQSFAIRICIGPAAPPRRTP